MSDQLQLAMNLYCLALWCVVRFEFDLEHTRTFYQMHHKQPPTGWLSPLHFYSLQFQLQPPLYCITSSKKLQPSDLISTFWLQYMLLTTMNGQHVFLIIKVLISLGFNRAYCMLDTAKSSSIKLDIFIKFYVKLNWNPLKWVDAWESFAN